MASAPELEELARAVADGEQIDWETAAAGDAVSALHDLEALGSAFRAVMTHTGDTGGPEPPRERVLFIWGHLQVLELLGSGSSGDVYRAFDPLLQREVALKLWRDSELSKSPGRRRTLHEARLLARVRHPHVVAVHGADVHDGRAGLWTDLVRGETLEKQLADRGTLSAEEAALIGVDLCRALAAVHGCGLVHGDVKAANVMREEGGRIVLTDFGAGAENGSGRELATFATPLAAAPEVLRGDRPTAAADLYGLAVLLYRLVASRYPFEADSLGLLREKHATERPAPLRDSRPEVPAAFAAAVERGLAARPEDRYASAGEMERALLQALPDPQPVRSGRWTRRRIAFVSAAVVLALALGGAALLSRSPRPVAAVRAIAVLPFETRPATPEHLGPAAALALGRRLRTLEGLEVIPTVTALRMARSAREADRHAGEAVPGAVLHGLVEASGGAARLEVELLSADDGRPLWSTSVSDGTGSLANAEAEAASRLARALRMKWAPASLATTGPPGGTGWKAEHELLAADFYTDRRTVASLDNAIACLHRAIEADPDLAAAHAGMARAWAIVATLENSDVPANLAWARARAAALRALEVDPDLAAGHVALADVAFRHDWDWRIAELELSRALSLAPQDPDALETLAELLSTTGRHEEALAVATRAVEAAPWSAPVRTTAGFVALEAGRFDDAVEYLRVALQLDPGYHAAYAVLGSLAEEQGATEEAVSQWQNSMVLAGSPPAEAEQLGRAFASAGMPGVWTWRLRRLQQQHAAGRASPALLARAHAALDHREEALRWLGRAIEEHDDKLLAIKEDPAFDTVRATPAFVELQRKLGLDDWLFTAGFGGGDPRLSVDAALYRERGGRPEALASGAVTRPGDRLFLAVTCQEPIYLYVLNEDRRGELFVLFPLPDLEVTNPLPARRRHRLPGTHDNVVQDWVVTSAGGRETILIVAARTPVQEVELEVGRLRVADAGRPVVATPVGRRLRGVGGLTADTPADATLPASRLTRLAALLADRAARGEVWLRQIVLENPGG